MHTKCTSGRPVPHYPNSYSMCCNSREDDAGALAASNEHVDLESRPARDRHKGCKEAQGSTRGHMKDGIPRRDICIAVKRGEERWRGSRPRLGFGHIKACRALNFRGHFALELNLPVVKEGCDDRENFNIRAGTMVEAERAATNFFHPWRDAQVCDLHREGTATKGGESNDSSDSVTRTGAVVVGWVLRHREAESGLAGEPQHHLCLLRIPSKFNKMGAMEVV
ncbi:hypothetical protein K488DRAFT_67665 [Vararia minispora EC-137]|uniref:Uncharacterized protein n=1 Tax=Vararia minispora EC-137 TaxID=1314806 RepID=A0ACB8QWY2_9AGAM|nr:hypothetical protein K488DRAFT_67665 [Vararia minispora EC-137]